jgi:hypothetical protein
MDHTKSGGDRIAPNSLTATIDADTLEAALKVLRLHGFALVYYGGNVLDKAYGEPTLGRTWRADLARACDSITDGSKEDAWRLGNAIEWGLFDLNRAGPSCVPVTLLARQFRKVMA